MDSHKVFLTTLLFLFDLALAGVIDREGLRSRRMLGGTVLDACSYPGAVALTHPTLGMIYCMGAHRAGKVLVPLECAKLIKTVNANLNINVRGGDGSGSASIAKGTMTVTDNTDGTASVGPMTSALPAGACANASYTLYPPASTSVDAATCTVVSYSGSVNATLYKYDSKLKTARLVASPLLDCGSLVLANVASSITTTSYGTVSTALYSTKDVTITKTASTAFCKGDLGAPIYCLDSSTNTNVLVGLVGSSQCKEGETFLSYDLTGGLLAGFSLAA